METKELNLRNGVGVEALEGLIGAMRAEPQVGTVSVRTKHRWADGFGVESRPESFEQAGQVFARTHHSIRTDWPEPFGADSGPTPGAELFLTALGACVATTYAVQATSRGVEIDELEVTVEGKVDLQGLFELNGIVPVFSDVKVAVHVRSKAGEDVIAELGETTSRTSPVFNSFVRPVDVELGVRRMGQV